MKKINIIFKILFICCLFGYHQGFAQYIRPIFPKDGQMIYTDTVHFQWNQYLATSTYHLQIAADTAFTQLMVNADVQRNDTLIRGFAPDTTYYWRIMPQGGTYGPVFRFIYFTPRLIPNLVGWYVADSCHITQSGNIDILYDKSGNNNDLIQSTSNKRPMWVEQDSMINNYPSIYFDGTTYQLYMDSNLIVTQPNTYCFVCKSITTSSSAFALFSGNVASPRNHLSHTTQVYRMLATSTIDGLNSYPQTFEYSRFYAYFNGNKSYAKKNDTMVVSGNVGTASMSGLRLAGTSAGAYMKGYIPEFIYYHATLDSVQDRLLAQYMSEKYHGRLNLGENIVASSFCSVVLQPDREYESYLWSTGDTTPSISVQQNGTYWLTTINRFGWQETDTIEVTFPVPLINDTLICYGDSVQWNFTQDYPYSFQWSNGQTGTFAEGVAGDYSVLLTDSNNCTYQQNFTIYADSLPYLTSIASADSLCNGNSITLSYPQETEKFHVVWSTGDSNSLHTVFTQTGWYGVQVRDSIGCIGRDSLYIIKKGNAPLASFTADNICLRDSTTFVNTSSTDDGSTIIFSEWTLGDGQDFTPVSALQGFRHRYDSAGMYVVHLHCVSSSGCEQDYQSTVAVYSLPQPEFSPVTACEDAPVSFQNLTRSEYRVTDYIWYFAPEDSTSQIHPEHVFADTGMHQVLLVAKAVTGCVDSISHTLYIKPNPQAAFTHTRPCVGEELYLNDITALPVNKKVINRRWSVNGQPLEGSANHARMQIQQQGSYHITLQLQYLNGCLSETEGEVKVASLPHAAFSVNNLCQYDTLQIQNTSSAGTGNVLTYQWHYLGQVYNDTLPVIPADSAGTFALKLYVYDTNACADSAWQHVTVSPSPQADFSYAYTQDGFYTLHFTNLSQNAESYQWQFDVLGTSTEENPDFDFQTDGSYEVSLTAANANSCTNEQKVQVILPAYDLNVELLDFQLLEQKGILTPQVLVLNKSNRALPLLQYTFTYDNITFYETDSLPLPAGEMRQYIFPTSVAKRNTADYACVHLYTPYDDWMSPAPEAEKREKCILLHSGNFVQAPYPNPAQEQVQLCYGVQNPASITWQIYNIHGQLLADAQQKNDAGIHYRTIDIRPYPQGVYMLRVIIGDEVFEYKIVKK
ncbi:MAG: T9SS type A sorting domain-containing protein [Bacteroidales bacterium]|nr:T9SS type A sorting domain-containing protein [Bacteroidales bacterium]